VRWLTLVADHTRHVTVNVPLATDVPPKVSEPKSCCPTDGRGSGHSSWTAVTGLRGGTAFRSAMRMRGAEFVRAATRSRCESSIRACRGRTLNEVDVDEDRRGQGAMSTTAYIHQIAYATRLTSLHLSDGANFRPRDPVKLRHRTSLWSVCDKTESDGRGRRATTRPRWQPGCCNGMWHPTRDSRRKQPWTRSLSSCTSTSSQERWPRS